MAEYNVVLKDTEGYDIFIEVVSGLVAAKKKAKYFLTEDYARNLGTSHPDMGTHSVEVQNARTGVCEWGEFRRDG